MPGGHGAVPQFVSIGAEHQPKRRRGGVDGGDHHLGGFDRITRLPASLPVEELLDGRDQRPVLVHLPGGAHVRIARELGAEVAGLDDRDLDAERGNLVPQRLAPGLKGELARAVSAKPADRD